MALTIAKQAAGAFAYSAVSGWVAVGANALVVSDEVDLSALNALSMIEFDVEWMPVGTATPTKGCRIAIQANLQNSGASDRWFTKYEVVTGLSAATAYAMDGNNNAGTTVIDETTSTAGLVVSGFVGFAHATLQSSEVGRVVAISAGASFTLADGLANNHAAAEAYYNMGEKFAPAVIDMSAIARMRCLFENNYQAGTAVAGRGRITYREMRVTS